LNSEERERNEERANYPREVRRRVNRIRGARQRRSGWHGLAQVGVLAWTFLLPTLGGVVVGRILWRLGAPGWLRVAGLGLGLLIGLYAAWRQIQKSLEDEEKLP
jgi:ATP synthase protein I